MLSHHYEEERQNREAVIRKIGLGHIIHEVTKDSGHKNGPERYQITDTGIIIVRNARTGRLVTKLVARPMQIRRYFPNAPKALLDLARKHQESGFNET